MCIRHSEKYYYRKEAGFQGFAGQEVKLRERNKVPPQVGESWKRGGKYNCFHKAAPFPQQTKGISQSKRSQGGRTRVL